MSSVQVLVNLQEELVTKALQKLLCVAQLMVNIPHL